MSAQDNMNIVHYQKCFRKLQPRSWWGPSDLSEKELVRKLELAWWKMNLIWPEKREREKERSGNGWSKEMNENVISKVLRLFIVSNVIYRCLFVMCVSSFGSLPTSVSYPSENSTLSHESSGRWPSLSSHSRWERQTKESFGWRHNRLVCLHNRLSAAASGSVSVNQPTVFLIVSVGTSSVLPCQVRADLCFSSAVRQILAILTLKGFNGVTFVWHTARGKQIGEKQLGSQLVGKKNDWLLLIGRQ